MWRSRPIVGQRGGDDAAVEERDPRSEHRRRDDPTARGGAHAECARCRRRCGGCGRVGHRAILAVQGRDHPTSHPGKPGHLQARRVDGVSVRQPSSELRNRPRRGAVLALLFALGAVGCTGSGSDSAGARAARATRPPATVGSPAVGSPAPAPAPTTTTVDLSALPSCWPDASFAQPVAVPVPGDLAAALDAFASDTRIGGEPGISLGVDRRPRRGPHSRA